MQLGPGNVLTKIDMQGAVFVYRYLIHTQFLKHEAKIDNLLAQAEASAWNYAYYLRAQAVTYGRQMLASSLDQVLLLKRKNKKQNEI